MKKHSTKKINFEEVASFFKENGYKLLEQTYINSTQKLKTICPKGHSYEVSYQLFSRRNFRCPTCSGNKNKTIEEVKQIFLNRNYTPLFDTYKRNTHPLLIKCKNGHEWKVSLCNFNKGIECPQCTGYTVRHTLKNVKDYIEKYDYKLLSKEYVNANSKLSSLCPKGHEYQFKFGDFKTGYRCALCVKKHESKKEIEILNWIQNFYPTAKKKRFRNEKTKKLYEVDIYIEELSLAIEFNGIFWHSERFLTDKNHHYKKMKDLQSKNIRLITIFEDEWTERQEQVKNFILSVIKSASFKVFARDTEVKEVSSKEARVFLDKYHIQGQARAGVYLGLFYKDELLGIISGGEHHRGAGGDLFVLNRLAFKSDTLVVGGSSRLLSYLVSYTKSKGYKKLISWSDNRWSEGNVYKKMGFTLEEELPPDYSYSKNKRRFSKQSCKKKDLLKQGGIGETEYEMATSLGYVRLWDCGKLRWVINI